MKKFLYDLVLIIYWSFIVSLAASGIIVVAFMTSEKVLFILMLLAVVVTLVLALFSLSKRDNK